MIWAAVSPHGPDRLVAVRPDDGQVATSVELDTFGAAGIASVGDQLWVTTAGGEAVVLPIARAQRPCAGAPDRPDRCDAHAAAGIPKAGQ